MKWSGAHQDLKCKSDLCNPYFSNRIDECALKVWLSLGEFVIVMFVLVEIGVHILKYDLSIAVADK